MNHALLRFRSFVFPSNPSSVEMSGRQNVQTSLAPFGTSVVQNLGSYARVYKGSGKFLGSGARDNAVKIQKLFEEGGKGALFISGLPPITAILSKLSIAEHGKEDGVSYSFEFVEVPERKKEVNGKQYVLLHEDENLWDVASSENIPIEKMMEMNPSFMTPFTCRAGQEVRVR